MTAEPSPDTSLAHAADLAARARGMGLDLAVGADGQLVVKGDLTRAAVVVDELRKSRDAILAHLAATPPDVSPPLLRQQHPAFAAIGSQGFTEMLELQRYVSRQPAFNRMIESAQDHYWTPFDRRFLDFEQPFDVDTQPLAAETWFPVLETPSVRARLTDERDRVRFINQVMWMRLSTLLHGEQGALNLSASLCGILKDPGAQEFASTQTREEARHVAAFSLYIQNRWGTPAPCLPQLSAFLTEIIESTDVSKKIIGMQIVVEGLAMGNLAELYQMLLDPVAKRLVQLVMTDESFHHRFGKMWCDLSLPNLQPGERAALETWTQSCLQRFITRMNPPYEQIVLRQMFGLDPRQTLDELHRLPRATHVPNGQRTFRVLTRVLDEAGLLSPSARAAYQAFLTDGPDDDLEGEIVEGGLSFLMAVSADEPRTN